METLEAIRDRKSVRSYTGESVSKEQLDKILRAAEESPIAMGKYEDYHLTVVEDRRLLADIDAAGAALFGDPDMHPLYGAPTYVLVSARRPEAPRMNSVLSSAAIVVHSMGLAATDLGVGNCYIWGATAAMAAQPGIVERLGLPDGFMPCCGIVLGQSEERYAPRDVPVDRIGRNTVAG